jgi:hypothetical protein
LDVINSDFFRIELMWRHRGRFSDEAQDVLGRIEASKRDGVGYLEWRTMRWNDAAADLLAANVSRGSLPLLYDNYIYVGGKGHR